MAPPSTSTSTSNTRRHVGTGLDPDAEANLQALRDLHQREIQEHGEDNLTPQEAYPRVLKECPGYIRGLGAGPKPLKRARLAAVEVREEIQQMEEVAAERESALRAEIGKLNTEMERMKQESLDRENKLKQEMIDRENKIKQEMMAEIARIMRGAS